MESGKLKEYSKQAGDIFLTKPEILMITERLKNPWVKLGVSVLFCQL